MKSLLIPLTYFCLQTCLGTAQVELNMMRDAFDDQYIGCAEKMERSASALLAEEKSKSSHLDDVWGKATVKWEEVKRNIPLPRNFRDEYGIAIVAYTYSSGFYNKYFSTEFNLAVKENGKSRDDYMNNFQFKAFHYYLTRALQLLRGKCDVMYKTTVYRGVKDTFQHSGSDPIRFGHFASSSVNKEVAKGFGTDTLFTIHTCFGVDIKKFSFIPVQEEVLIPVHEKFRVTPDGSNRFVLWSTNKTCSHFNCAHEGREKNDKCVDNSATRGGVAFPGGMIPSLFGGSIILIHAAALKLTAGF
ncbi:ecto-ADP-ribosyltransferase 5-like [Pelodiscus sinensis]|uniref:ecto-ADP-ribosyltransferase 5-like n=1 Tax=Pelodiscus sinensis TaxID=13735 RepID=UPI003F6B1921